jgi:hypothetical protein
MSMTAAPEGWLLQVDAAQTPIALISQEGRVFLRDEQTGELAESYDWAQFGRLVYEAVTHGKTPPERCPTCSQLPCDGWWSIQGEGPRRCQAAPEKAWMPG